MAEAKKTATKAAEKEAGSKEKVQTEEKKPTQTTVKKKATANKKKNEKEHNNGVTEKSDKTTVETGQEPVEEVSTGVQADEQAEVDSDDASKPLAKSGKRSEKAIKEAEEKEAKEERKATAAAHKADDKPKVVKQRTAEDRLKARGKKFRKAAEMVDNDKEYGLKEALELAIKTSLVKFDATVELHINLGVDPKHADQNVRGNLVLPAGTGNSVRVAVLADADGAEKAKKAGADISDADALLGALEKGVIEFDTLIAAPAMMAKLGKYARTLGPKGLMPNPKSGTVTADVAKAVKEAKAGKLDYRVDSTGIVHVGFGKVSFGADKLGSNVRAVLTSIKAAKPASVKGNYVKSLHITTSMGPSVRVATTEAN